MADPMFPILRDDCIKAIPIAFIAPHEAQAQRNHSQSLRALASRGGLSVTEAEAAVMGRRLSWGTVSAEEVARARANLMMLLWKWTKELAVPASTKEPSTA